MGLPDQFKTQVVGVTFVPGYPSNVLRLNDIAAERYLTTPAKFGSDVEPEPLPAILVRNPANEHDSNAIEVHIPAMGDVAMIGHCPRTVAAQLAPLIDSGEKWAASVTMVQINQDHPNNPGVQLAVSRVNAGEPF